MEIEFESQQPDPQTGAKILYSPDSQKGAKMVYSTDSQNGAKMVYSTDSQNGAKISKDGDKTVFTADGKTSAGIVMNVGKVETTNNIYNTIIV